MPTDFRSGYVFPRRGRDVLDGYVWLARLLDKARAKRDGTLHDYDFPCPIDRGVMDRWGISERALEAALDNCATDAEFVAWLRPRVSDERRSEANRWLLEERASSLDALDAEEGVVLA